MSEAEREKERDFWSGSFYVGRMQIVIQQVYTGLGMGSEG
jgi:hypothetical protein